WTYARGSSMIPGEVKRVLGTPYGVNGPKKHLSSQEGSDCSWDKVSVFCPVLESWPGPLPWENGNGILPSFSMLAPNFSSAIDERLFVIRLALNSVTICNKILCRCGPCSKVSPKSL